MIIDRLLDLPPRVSARKIRQRILGTQGGFDVENILQTPRLMRSQRFYDFLSRYEAILLRADNWKSLEFDERDVLEIGCGQMLGFGPIAIFRGANSYSGIEPLFDDRVLHAPEIVDTYYLHVFKDLSAIYGPLLSFDEFMMRLRTRVTVNSEYLVESSFTGPFDVVISNSCLEHIFDFEASMSALHKRSAPNCRYLHLVDFANHLLSKHPFDGLYSVDPDTFWSKHGRNINLHRLPEIIQGLENAGFKPGVVPYSHFPEAYSGSLHPYWRERYPDDQILFLKTAIIHSAD
ncbi:MAG TPA: methyltransferase domain-containing protein [Sneathiellales bacterium]|nr:methyltransferase domain-containing protein [Sneathiellales bacterium]